MPDVRSAIWDLLRLPSRLAFRRSLASRELEPPRGKIALNYGGALSQRQGKIVAGGAVKLLQLAERWPECEKFSILYLVSSAPPAHAIELVRWAKSRGARFVWNQNGVAFPAWAGNRLEATNRPMRELLREADFVVYQSGFCQRSADRFLRPISVSSQVLFNPVDLREFRPPASPPPLDCWQLLTAGTHHDAARVLVPLQALRLLLDAGHSAELTIAGALRWRNADAETREKIAALQLESVVKFRPAFGRSEAPAIYQNAHVLLHPKYHDPCPTVVIEALACGLPVLGSASGGLPELVGDDLLEVPLSWEHSATPAAESFAAAIEQTMREWSAKSQAARARAERHFDAAAWTDAHQEIFDRVLHGAS